MQASEDQTGLGKFHFGSEASAAEQITEQFRVLHLSVLLLSLLTW